MLLHDFEFDKPKGCICLYLQTCSMKCWDMVATKIKSEFQNKYLCNMILHIDNPSS